eukprot:SAG11_NODE_20741_length_439_cov_0.761765_1_plen_48_part_01
MEAELVCREKKQRGGFVGTACKSALAQKLVLAKANIAAKPALVGSPLL